MCTKGRFNRIPWRLQRGALRPMVWLTALITFVSLPLGALGATVPNDSSQPAHHPPATEYEEWIATVVRYLVLLSEGALGATLLCLLLAGGLLLLARKPHRMSWLGLILIVAAITVLVIRAITISFFGFL